MKSYSLLRLFCLGLLFGLFPKPHVVGQSVQCPLIPINRVEGSDTLLYAFKYPRSCGCEQDYFQVLLSGFRMNLTLLADDAFFRRKKKTLHIAAYIQIHTPVGFIEKFIPPEAFQQLENKDPKHKKDDLVFFLASPDQVLSGPIPAEIGAYQIKVSIYKVLGNLAWTDNQVQTKPRPDLPLKTRIDDWVETDMLEEGPISWETEAKIYLENDFLGNRSSTLTMGHSAVMGSINGQSPALWMVDDRGLLLQDDYSEVEEDYLLFKFKRKAGFPISELPEILTQKQRLNRKVIEHRSTQVDLNETFELIDRLNFITDYDRYIHKITLVEEFGQEQDFAAYALPPAPPCGFVPSSLNQRDQWIYLVTRQTLIRIGEIPPGRAIGQEEWQYAVDAIPIQDLWHLAKRYYASDMQRTLSALKSLGTTPKLGHAPVSD